MSMLTIIVIIIGMLLTIFLIIGVYCCCKVASKDEIMRDKIMIQYLEDLVFNNKEDDDKKDE